MTQQEEKIVKGFLDARGRVKQMPSKYHKRLMVLEYLWGKFEPDRRYTEAEVGEVLLNWHTFGDVCLLRRELYEAGYLDREKDCSAYWRNAEPPAREE
ncbi:MAG: DUF2087 domain-containing protein [Eubacteriales bacterium]|nr:DUF2087 domain-containing protein [Eubacteriales bacterium]